MVVIVCKGCGVHTEVEIPFCERCVATMRLLKKIEERARINGVAVEKVIDLWLTPEGAAFA